MAIVAVAIYGSRARRDHSLDSDVDILAITAENKLYGVSRNNINMYFYPRSKFQSDARAGNLFVLHIVEEAISLYDNDSIFDDARKNFRYQGSYAREIQGASDVGWFIDQFGNRLLNYADVNRKMAWVARTILIARAAEERKAIFSVAKLADYSGSEDLLAIVNHRNSTKPPKKNIISRFRRFLKNHSVGNPGLETISDYRRLFKESDNKIGLKLVNRIERVSKTHAAGGLSTYQ